MFTTVKEKKIGTSVLEQISWTRFEIAPYWTDLAGKSGGTCILNTALHALMGRPCVEYGLRYVDSPTGVQKYLAPGCRGN